MKGGLKWLTAQMHIQVVVHLDQVFDKSKVKMDDFSVKMKQVRNKCIKSLLLFHKAQDNKREARLYEAFVLQYIRYNYRPIALPIHSKSEKFRWLLLKTYLIILVYSQFVNLLFSFKAGHPETDSLHCKTPF